MCTYNTKSLLPEGRLVQLEEEIKNVNWDLIKLSEVRRKGEDLNSTTKKIMFHYKRETDNSSNGVGTLINEN